MMYQGGAFPPGLNIGGNRYMYSIKEYSKQELQILSWIKDLSMSKGSYHRLLNELKYDRELLKELASQNFNDMLDMVMYLES